MEDAAPPRIEPAPAPVSGPGPVRPSRSFGYVLTELFIVTAGVLIALSVDSFREWRQDRALVEQARGTIAREIAANKEDVERVLSGTASRRSNLDAARRMANELLATRKTGITEISLGASLSDLSDAAWVSAERTGALSNMDYGEVQGYSQLYAVQEVYADQQRESVRRIAEVLAVLSEGDPHQAAPQDLEQFRQGVRALLGALHIEEQLGQRLVELYAEALARIPS